MARVDVEKGPWAEEGKPLLGEVRSVSRAQLADVRVQEVGREI